MNQIDEENLDDEYPSADEDEYGNMRNSNIYGNIAQRNTGGYSKTRSCSQGFGRWNKLNNY